MRLSMTESAKFPSSIIGHGERIVIDADVTRRVDWEVELAAVIGRTMDTVCPLGPVVVTSDEIPDPHRRLRPGDVVEAEVESIGVLRNPVIGS